MSKQLEFEPLTPHTLSGLPSCATERLGEYGGIVRSGISRYVTDPPDMSVFWSVDRETAQRVEDVTARSLGRPRRVLTKAYRCMNCAKAWWQESSNHPFCPKCKTRRVRRLNKPR